VAICKSCGLDKILVKSHLIPESFVRATDDGSGMLLEITDRVGVFPRRRPIGHYDSNILCYDCEVKLGIPDDYGFKILSQCLGEQIPKYNGTEIGYYTQSGVDVDLLKQFLVSVLWRLSVSTIDFANLISLGQFESRAKEIAFGDQSSEHEFSFFLSRFKPDPKSSIMISPFGQKFMNCNFATIFFPEIQAWLKVDNRNTAPDLMKFLPKNGTEVILIARDINTSPELTLINKLYAGAESR